MPNDPSVQVPLHVLQALVPAAELAGISLPGFAKFAPTINAGMPMRALAYEVGRLVAKQDLYMMAGGLVTVDKSTGVVEAMTPGRFVGWVEEFCAIQGVKEASLSRERAGLILAQDVFRSCIRPLTAVHLMRLPVVRAGELFKVEFLEAGYDQASGIFTAPVVGYEMDWDVERAKGWFREHCEEFPWAWPEAGEGCDTDVLQRGAVEGNRNYAVHVAACLGSYCRAMFPPGVARPMVTYTGNQAGTGKSTLASMALMHVYGNAATAKTPKDDDKMDAELETVAQSMKPYLFLDDIGQGLFSNPLNRFILSDSHTARIYGQNKEMFEVAHVTQVFTTGKAIKTSPDLVRRSLIVELFLAGEVRGRKFQKVITLRYLKRLEVRAGFLAACCALVNHWMDCGMVMHGVPLESFEDWTGAVGGMMSVAGFCDVLKAPDLSAGGAEEEDDLRELLVAVATAAVGDETFDRKGLVAKARELGLLENMLGSGDGGDIDSNTSKKFGRQLQQWRGRELRDRSVPGRLFRFGHHRRKSGATYPLTFLKG